MFLGIPQSIVTLATIIIFYVMDFILIRRYDKQRQASGSSGSGRSWDFTFFIFTMVAVLVLQPVIIPILSVRIQEIWGLFIQILGVITLVTALALHFWSRVHLQHFYAERVEVQPVHKVIDTGPYKLMRHPVITSFFGIATGLFLINPALTTLAALIYTIWDFTRAARQEEELLSKTLPGYADYAHRTPRFLPRLWRS
jgi:protein-S-isoprenylcysteine O-methyltransferase Ste14